MNTKKIVKKSKKKQRQHPSFDGRQALNIDQLLAAAIKDHQAGNLKQAEKIYCQILSVSPNHAETLHALAIMACQHKQHATAVPLFQKAIGESPTKAAYHYNLGNAFKSLENFPEAMSCYQHALSLQPDYYEALNNLGTILHHQGKFDEAISVFEDALRTAPSHAESLYNLATSLQAMNKLRDAVFYYQKVLVAKENFPEAYHRLGNIFHSQGKLDAAIGCFQEALRINPTASTFYFDLATAYNDHGLSDEAIICYKKAIELEPGFTAAHNNLGNIFKERGLIHESISFYEQALRHSPDYAIAYGNLGAAYTQVGNIDKAIGSCFKALEINPDIPEVYMLLAELLSLTQSWEKFIRLADTILENQNLSDENQNWLYIQKALHAWMSNDLINCAELIHAASSIELLKPENISGTSRLSFYCLLKKLNDYRTNSPHLYPPENNPPVYVIGDSHCLSFANLPVNIDENHFSSVGQLVMGCKAYHLSQKGHNKYKEGLLRNVANISDGSTVILSFGEIDCRTDEGIYPAWLNKYQHMELEKMVRDLATGYLSFIYEITKKRDFQLMLLGVPAPLKDTFAHLSDESIETYLAIPRHWNKYLQYGTLKKGWAFLDNYSLTCDNQGFSNGYYHIDARHLYPAALARLMSRHSIKPHTPS